MPICSTTATLYVAVFNDDGSGNWIPLVYGENGLDATNDIADQAAILINPRVAGDVVGATKMDRPEDIEVNPVNQKVYMVMTNNNRRGVEDNPGTDESNPRPENIWGHIIEVTEAGGDHAATEFEWDIFLLCGDPADESTYFAGFPKEKVSKMANPDNITFDSQGQSLDLHRRPARLAGGQRRTLRRAGRWRGPRLPAPVLQRGAGCGSLRAALHAGQHDPLRRDPASRRGRHLRRARHELAGRIGPAAASHGGDSVHHRRPDRFLIGAPPLPPPFSTSRARLRAARLVLLPVHEVPARVKQQDAHLPTRRNAA